MTRKLGLLLIVPTVLGLIALQKNGVSHFFAGDQSGGSAVDPDGSSERATKRSRDAESGPTRRKKQLDDLIKRWNLSKPLVDPRSQTPERQALIKEAVGTLLCSPELVKLIEILDKEGCAWHRELINQTVAGLLRTESADEVRKSLLSLVALNGESYSEIDNIFRHWVKEAGTASTAGQLEEFCEKLSTDRSKLDALGAFNLELAKSKPTEAVISTLEKLGIWEFSGSIESSFQRQLEMLPSTADFAGIERIVPLPTGTNPQRDDALGLMREGLLWKWSESDPAGAANHIMANPDRLPTKYLATVSQQLCNRNIESALEWVQTFPDGQYYDAAVSGIILQLSQIFPNEAAELAGRIENSELRKKHIAELMRIGVIKKNGGKGP